MARHSEDAEVTLKINDKEAQRKLERLESEASNLRKKFAQAFRDGDVRGIEKYNKELQRVNKQIEAMRTNAANIRAAMTRLDQASPKELKRILTLINTELNSGRVKRGSKEWEAYTAQLRRVRAELQSIRKEQGYGEKFLDSIAGKFTKWWGAYTIIGETLGNMELRMSKMKENAREKEDARANLQALTGLDDSNIEWLTEQAERLATKMDESGLRIKQSSKEILEAYTLVGSNKPELLNDKEALNSVTVEAMRLAAAAKIELQPAADAMTTALNQYGESAEKAASYVNVLAAGSKVGAANVQQQAAAILKSGTAAASANVPIEGLVGSIEMLGEKGIKGEGAGTGLKKFFLVLQTGAAATNPKVVGLSTALENLKKKVDAAEKASVGGGASFLKKMFGEEAYSIAAILTDNIKKVNEYTQAVTGTNIAVEQAARNSDTASARMEQMRNRMQEAGIEIAEKLNPSLESLTELNIKLINRLPDAIDFARKHHTAIMALVAAYIAYKIAMVGHNTVKQIHNKLTELAILKTNLHTAATTAGRVAAIAYTHGISGAVRALRAMNLTMASTPWGAVATLIGMAAAAVVAYATHTSKAAEANKRLSETTAEVEKETRKEIEKIDDLFMKLNSARKGTKEYEKAKNDILTQYGQYLRGLGREVESLDNVAEAYRIITREARNAAKARGLANATSKADDAFNDTLGEQSKDLNEALRNVEKKVDRGNKSRKLTDREIRKWQQKILDAASEGSFSDDVLSFLKSVGVWRTRSGSFNGSGAGDDIANAINEILEAASTRTEEIKQANIAFGTPQSDYAGLDYENLRLTLEDLRKLLESGAAAQPGGASLKIRNGKTVSFGSSAEIREEISELEVLIERALDSMEGVTVTPEKKNPAGAALNSESDEERKEREKKEKAAQAKARAALKKDLDERKAMYQQADAENLTLYVTGEQDYLQYCTKREALEQGYVNDVVKIHEEHNKIDMAAYGTALKQKADLLKKHQDAERKRKLSDIETEHAAVEDALVKSFYDAGSPDFQNTKALNEKLFQEDIRYLNEKKKLYLKGSEERAAIEKEINDRIARNQLDKLKETADALAAFEKEYRQASGSQREKLELELLKSLKDQKLITEEEYQKASRKIRQKYRDEDLQKVRENQTEYNDMVNKLHDSIIALVSGIREGTFSFVDLAAAATSAYAIMSAALSQYAAYSNAERDLELAKTEKRYDKEIAAAGKNEKKKKRLEEQKEADIAKIKKRYNDRAMKMELAQAIAGTATAAINAYASGAKEHWALGAVAAALATAAGMAQIATIKKQHEAEAAGYYEGGFTSRDADNRKEVGVVHANEFVANHKAVANPALAPVLRLIDYAQRNNTVGSLTSADVSNAIGGAAIRLQQQRPGSSDSSEAVVGALAVVAETTAANRAAIDRLSENIEGGIETVMIMDGERGFHKKYQHYLRLNDNPRR